MKNLIKAALVALSLTTIAQSHGMGAFRAARAYLKPACIKMAAATRTHVATAMRHMATSARRMTAKPVTATARVQASRWFTPARTVKGLGLTLAVWPFSSGGVDEKALPRVPTAVMQADAKVTATYTCPKNDAFCRTRLLLMDKMGPGCAKCLEQEVQTPKVSDQEVQTSKVSDQCKEYYKQLTGKDYAGEYDFATYTADVARGFLPDALAIPTFHQAPAYTLDVKPNATNDDLPLSATVTATANVKIPVARLSAEEMRKVILVRSMAAEYADCLKQSAENPQAPCRRMFAGQPDAPSCPNIRVTGLEFNVNFDNSVPKKQQK